MKTILKRTVFIFLCMILSVITFGQEKKQYSDEIKGITVSPPRFTGNIELLTLSDETQFGSLNDFLMKNVQYPEKAKEALIEGTEVVKFVVTDAGKVTDFKITNSVSPEIDQEVIRVLKTTNNMWRPGTQNGKPAAIEQEISIAFMLDMSSGTDINKEFYDLAKRNFIKGNNKLFAKENSKSALKYYTRAVCYLPNDKALLVTRGMCKYELGDKNGACQDWNRIKTLGGFEGDAYLDNFCGMKGYAEMISTLQEKK